MKINNIRLRNYRCFEDIGLEFHDKFNLIVGINGTGKTAILEALRIAIGSLFLKVDKYDNKISSPSIWDSDVRLQNLEQQFPAYINTEGEINEFEASSNLFETLAWERGLETKGGRTTHINAKDMKDASAMMMKQIRNTEVKTIIPLIAYYSTERFKKEKNDVGVKPDGSRLRGYYNALDTRTNINFFLELWNTETLSDLQNSTQSPMLTAVAEAVMSCINNCEEVKFDIKRRELIMTMKDTHEKLPFHVLSDGVRSMFAMVMEIAFRCYLLNPHLEERAARETSGVVLIDEVDLHLHPAWQMRVIDDLRRTFPAIQFIVTTHAPLVIGSLSDGQIFNISDRSVFEFPLQHGRDANYILREMGSDEMDKGLKNELQTYFSLIEAGNGKTEDALRLRAVIENKLGLGHTELERADLMLSFFK